MKIPAKEKFIVYIRRIGTVIQGDVLGHPSFCSEVKNENNFDDLYRELEQFQKMASCLFNKGAVLGVDICGENPKADQNRNNVFN